METKQNWAGCWVDQPCFSNFSEEGEQAREGGVLVPYQIPLKERKSEMGYSANWPAIFRGSYSDNPLAVGWGSANISTDKSQDVGVRQKLENIGRSSLISGIQSVTSRWASICEST